MKKCPKGHENPDNANYCRVCKHEFHPVSIGGNGNEERLRNEIDNLKKVLNEERDTKEFYRHKIMELENELYKAKNGGSTPPPKPPVTTKYTPDLFPTINLIPRSMFKPHFRSLLWIVLLLIILISAHILYVNCWELENELEDGDWIISIAAIIIGVFVAIHTLIMVVGSVVFKASVDFVESRPMSSVPGKIHRVAKKGKLGLFDGKKKAMRIYCNYDKIEKFDNEHLLVEVGGKVGVYSLTRKHLIIPAKYNSISPFKNYIASATWDRGVDHYDIKGNLKR